MAPPVVVLLIHQPVAICHIAGVEVGEAETVHEIRTVIRQFHHSAFHVEMLIQPHPEAATVLQRSGKSNSHIRFVFCEICSCA